MQKNSDAKMKIRANDALMRGFRAREKRERDESNAHERASEDPCIDDNYGEEVLVRA